MSYFFLITRIAILVKTNLGHELIELQNIFKNWGIYNLISVKISHVPRILASQNRFQSLYDEIFYIDRFLE